MPPAHALHAERMASMSQDQAPHGTPLPAPAPEEQRQTAGHPSAAQHTEQPEAPPKSGWDRAFQDCPWDEDPECICAENTLQEGGRGMDRDDPDI